MSDDRTLSLLEEVFGQGNVIPEWDVAKNSLDALQRRLQYCPRIDFAVRPLNIDTRIYHNQRLIDEAYQNFEDLIDTLIKNGLTCTRWTDNKNPRCFLAIEYENKTSTKHRLGSLINAGAIGKMGIIVSLNPKVYRSYDRILKYLEFLQQHKKTNELQNNYLVIDQGKFEEILREYVKSKTKISKFER